MGNAIRYLLAAIIAMLFAFSLFHASWIAENPVGAPKLIAAQPVDVPRDADGCVLAPPTARMWNSDYGSVQPAAVQMLQLAAGSGADAVVIESDLENGALVLRRSIESKCELDNQKPRASAALAFKALSRPEQFVRLSGPQQAKAALAAAPGGEISQIYFGDSPADIAPVSGSAAFSIETARQCAANYQQVGIWGGIPEVCANGTVLLTLGDLGIGLWGWPDRFLSRMADNDVRVIIAADVTEGGITGLTQLEQYSEIASSYNGYIWIDNIEELGPALKP